jgi:hypothetical protein
MKQTFNYTTVVLVTIFSLALSSCKKDNLLTNTTENALANTTVNGAAVVQADQIALLPVLIKHGGVELSYMPTGALASVKWNAQGAKKYSDQGDGLFGNGWSADFDIAVIAVQQFYNSSEIQRFKYELNSDGLAKSVKYQNKDSYGNWSLFWSASFTYNGLKQMIKISDGDSYSDLMYDANGNLTSVIYYDWNNVLVHETTFWYSDIGSALINDKNGLNPDNFYIDTYLKIFGKFRNHLPKRIKYNNNVQNGDKTDYTFDYVLDANGLIKTEKKYHTGFNVIVETKNFEYQ